jgi:hypothetical protein
MLPLALKTLDSLRRLFEADSTRGHSPVQHVLVVYPEYDFAGDVQARDGTLSMRPLFSRTDAPWPPAHAIRLPPHALREAAGCLTLSRGAWRAGWYGDIAAFNRLSELARDAGTAFRDATAGVRDVKERLWLSEALCLDDPADLWMTVVHQLGWRPLPGSPLKWKRYTWNDDSYWEVRSPRTRRRALKTARAGSRKVLGLPLPSDATPQHPISEPRAWHYSIAQPDLFRASAFAIDALLTVLEGPPVQAEPSRAGKPVTASGTDGPGTEPGRSPGPTPDSTKRRRQERLAWMTPFLGLLFQHPDWTLERLATEAGTTTPTVRRAARTQEKLKVALQARKTRDRAPRRGFRDVRTGQIEASDDHPDS